MAGPNLQMPAAVSQMFDIVRDQSGMVMSLNMRPDWASLFQSMQQLTFASTRYGPTAERPTSTMASRYIGMPYFDTDLGAKGEPVWRNKDNTGWVTLSGSSSGTGTVTSVNVSTAADLTVSTSGGPVTSTGTILITALDAGANKLVGWDDAASTKRYFDLGTGISITSTTINVSTGTGSLTSVAVSTVADATVSTTGSPITSSGAIVLTSVDAGSDQLVGWDDSASTKTYFSLGNGFSISSSNVVTFATFSSLADGQFNPIATTPGTAGEGMAYGTIIYLKTDTKWYKAKSDSSTIAGPVLVGANLISSAASSAISVLLEGSIRADAIYTSTLPAGALVFISSSVAGSITTTAPSASTYVTRSLGHANQNGADLIFRPSPDWLTHT